MAARLHQGAHNQRFTVASQDPFDAHLAYLGTPEELARTLSVQVTRTLSKNLSCQYENQLLQIETTGTGRGLRGAKVMVHEHFGGKKELLWKKRKLTYSVMEKPRRQAPVADSKSVNAGVDKAMARSDTGHTPAPDHPWRNRPLGKSAHKGQCAVP